MENNIEKYGQRPQQPTTIEELKLWYIWHNLPPEEVTRFFIGKDITEPKAFGIFKNEQGECVVYKNKANGERAIRYQGVDEAFAVSEILQRLRDEIAKQKARNAANRAVPSPMASSMKSPMKSSAKSSVNSSKSTSEFTKSEKGIGALVFAMIMALMLFLPGSSVPNGYYRYRGNHYYHQGSSWYLYKTSTNDWYRTTSLDNEITKENASQYRITHFSGKQFEDTQWYDDGKDDSWDNDTWDDNDDWDDSSTDWDSDW